MRKPLPEDAYAGRPDVMPSAQAGVGLIEALVALLVLSVGFLAAGGMQVRSMSGNQRAYHESQARLLLDDMMDRMRNNPRGVAVGAYDGRDTAGLVGAMPDCLTSGCAPDRLAVRDLFAWRAGIAPAGTVPRLPLAEDGEAAVGSISAPVDGVYTLTLTWDGFEGGETVVRSVSARFMP